MIRIAEEKKAAQLAALAKKNEKAPAKKKGGKQEEEKVLEVPKELPKSAEPVVKRELDLTNPEDFA